MSRPIEAVTARLESVRGSRARCPACGKAGSLAIRETNDGTVLVRCFRGCNTKDVTAAIGLDIKALFVARTPIEQRDKAEAESREREAFRRDPEAYLRGALRRAIAQTQERRRRELGYHAPLRSAEVDLCRRRIAARVSVALCEMPAAIGWTLWPGGSTTMPAAWEMPGSDEDPEWPGLFMRALEAEIERMRAVNPNISLETIENPWETIPNALHRAALRARAAMRRLSAARERVIAA